MPDTKPNFVGFDHRDYTLDIRAKEVRITVGNINICLIRTNEGVIVDLYADGYDHVLTTTSLTFDEADEVINPEV